MTGKGKKNKKRKPGKTDIVKKLRKAARETIGPIPPSRPFKNGKKYDRKKEKKPGKEE